MDLDSLYDRYRPYLLSINMHGTGSLTINWIKRILGGLIIFCASVVGTQWFTYSDRSAFKKSSLRNLYVHFTVLFEWPVMIIPIHAVYCNIGNNLDRHNVTSCFLYTKKIVWSGFSLYSFRLILNFCIFSWPRGLDSYFLDILWKKICI